MYEVAPSAHRFKENVNVCCSSCCMFSNCWIFCEIDFSCFNYIPYHIVSSGMIRLCINIL